MKRLHFKHQRANFQLDFEAAVQLARHGGSSVRRRLDRHAPAQRPASIDRRGAAEAARGQVRAGGQDGARARRRRPDPAQGSREENKRRAGNR